MRGGEGTVEAYWSSAIVLLVGAGLLDQAQDTPAYAAVHDVGLLVGLLLFVGGAIGLAASVLLATASSPDAAWLTA
jgi:hypothetical protein